MKKDDYLRVRPGRGRHGPALGRPQRARRGRAASLAAAHVLGRRTRLVAVKVRVVRQMQTLCAIAAHLRYLGRDGVTNDGALGRCSTVKGDEANGRAFVERCD